MRTGDAIDTLETLAEELRPSTNERRAALERLAADFTNLASSLGFKTREQGTNRGIHVERNLFSDVVWIVVGPKQDGLYFWVEKQAQPPTSVYKYSRTEKTVVGDPVRQPDGTEVYEPAVNKLAREFADFVRTISK